MVIPHAGLRRRGASLLLLAYGCARSRKSCRSSALLRSRVLCHTDSTDITDFRLRRVCLEFNLRLPAYDRVGLFAFSTNLPNRTTAVYQIIIHTQTLTPSTAKACLTKLKSRKQQSFFCAAKVLFFLLLTKYFLHHICTFSTAESSSTCTSTT